MIPAYKINPDDTGAARILKRFKEDSSFVYSPG